MLAGNSIEDQLGSLVDDADFQRIVRQRSTFNLFEALGAIRGELRHSNFLAFLLSPTGSHGLGAEPLTRFLRMVVTSISPAHRPLSSLELIVRDLDSAVVERERDNIDLLISIRDLNLIVLIENKIGARAGPGQLRRYRESVQKRFPHERKLFVFLTPDGHEPDDQSYVPVSYSRLTDMIQGLTGDAPPTDAVLAMRHYVDMLRRHIVPDQKLNELALQLYHRHQAAFDFIISNIPKSQGLFGIMKELRDSTDGLTPDLDSSVYVRFVPQAWAGVAELNKCPKSEWTKTGRHVLFEVKTYNSEGSNHRVNLALLVGPAPNEDRKHLWESALNRNFTGLVKPMGAKWAAIWSRDLLTQKAGKEMDLDAKREALEASWAAFLETDLPMLTAEVLQIVRRDPK